MRMVNKINGNEACGLPGSAGAATPDDVYLVPRARTISPGLKNQGTRKPNL
jgi:hypothetical protein